MELWTRGGIPESIRFSEATYIQKLPARSVAEELDMLYANT